MLFVRTYLRIGEKCWADRNSQQIAVYLSLPHNLVHVVGPLHALKTMS